MGDDSDEGNSNIDAIRQELLAKQRELAARVVVPDDDFTGRTVSENQDFRLLALLNDNNYSKLEYYGGVDVSFPDNQTKEQSVAVYVILDKVTMKVVHQDYEFFDLTIPYIPGLLAFREIDPLQRLIAKQKMKAPALTPRAILVDGNGILHPRAAGIACFVGVLGGIPAIGIGKTLFCQDGLTEALVAKRLDQSLQRAYDAIPSLEISTTTGEKVLFDKHPIGKDAKSVGKNNTNSNKSSSNDDDDMAVNHETCLDRLAKYGCRGLAIPLQAKLNNDNGRNAQSRILACALVGHGGRIGSNNKHKKTSNQRGTKKPTYVSVGHGLSLAAAVEIVVSLSLARIPEPVRQADAIGRKTLIEKTHTLQSKASKRKHTRTRLEKHRKDER